MILIDAIRERLEDQLDAHRPVDGRCPLCGTALCMPRLDAQALLTTGGVELDLTDDERVILALRRQYRDHRTVPGVGVCGVDGVAGCELGRAAWERLIELGLDPVGGLGPM